MPETSVQRRDEALPDKSGVSMSSISLSLEAEICPEDVRFVRYSRQLCNIVGSVKCFPVETEDYFYQVVRYVERNALRANLVERAESWRWSSLRRVEREDPAFPILSTWPLPRPTDWLQLVNQPQTEAEMAALRCCVNRGRPFGDPNWVTDTAKRLGLEWTIRPRGRPKKPS